MVVDKNYRVSCVNYLVFNNILCVIKKERIWLYKLLCDCFEVKLESFERVCSVMI